MNSRACSLAGTMIALSLTSIQNQAQSIYEPYAFTTLAGNAGYGSADGTGSAARFNSPVGVAVDGAGNVYVADSDNNTIRKVTPEGVVTTVAGLAGSTGSADGIGSAARFNRPSGVAVDSAGNIYVADAGNHTIRKVTPAGVVTTRAGLAQLDANGFPVSGSTDGTGSAARFNNPVGVAVDTLGNLYVAEPWNGAIRKVTPAGMVTTLAGRAGSDGSLDGTGSAAQFNNPTSVAVDDAGNVYVADFNNFTIRKVTPAGMVTTLAGLAGSFGSADGTGSAARFNRPYGVAVDSGGNVYVADSWNGAIRKVTPGGVVTTLAGVAGGTIGSEDGAGSAARFNGPVGVALDNAGNVYVADNGNNTIRKVTPAGVVTTLAGTVGYGSTDGTGNAARFNNPLGVAVDTAGNVYVADTYNSTIRKVAPAGVVTTLAGLADPGGYGANTDGTGSAARFSRPSDVAVDSAGYIYVADSGNLAIRKVTPAGVVTTLAGDGQFGNLEGLAVDSAGNVYVADDGNYTLRKVTPDGVVTTLAGLAGNRGRVAGTGSAARFYLPSGVAVDSAGTIYLADYDTIWKVTPAGVVTTLAGLAELNADGGPVGGYADGTGSDARFGGPPGLAGFSSNGRSGVAVDSAGNVYVADQWNQTIRKVTPAGVVTTLAGLADCDQSGYCPVGSADGTGSAARFNRPQGVAVDNAGNVYVADSQNNTIRKGSAAFMILTSGPDFGFKGGNFGFHLTGPAGRLVVVEASTDLMSWLPLWTNTFAVPLNFRDPRSGVSSNRSYRAHLP